MSIKCAEIYFSNSGNFTFTCILCNENFLKAINLAEHVIDNHIFSIYPDVLSSFLIADKDNELSKIGEIFGNKKELSLDESQGDVKKKILESIEDIKYEKLNIEKDDNKKTNDLFDLKIQIEKEIIVDVKLVQNEFENSNIVNDDNISKELLIPNNRTRVINNDDNMSKELSIPNNRRRVINKIKSKTAEKMNFLSTNNIPNSIYWQCHLCNITIKKKSKSQHIKIMHQRTKFSCKYCDESFLKSSKLKQHTRIHTGEPERPFQCSECFNKYKLLSKLNEHIKRVHLKLQNYKCSFCERAFFSNDEAKRHEISWHNQPKPYICELCGVGCITTQQFRNHKRRHAEPTFQCNKCDKKFHIKSSLERHQIVHVDYKPYECTICLTKFPRYKSYRTHMVLHSGIKDYICKICGKAFAQPSGIGCHMKSHGIKYSASNVIRKSKIIDENESQ